MKTERLSASVAGRHMACHASANLAEAIPNYKPPAIPTGVAAQKGTDVHEIFEKVWEFSARDIQAMIDTMQYIADLRATRRFKVLIEETVKAKWLVTEPNTTADLVLYVADEIHIIDTKWGKVPVEVVDNTQLLYYAACYGPLAPKAKGVWVHICQPHADGNKSWFITPDRLKQFMDEAKAAETAIQAGDRTFGPSDYCIFCPAYPHSRAPKGSPMCPVTMQLLYPRVDMDEDAILNA
jgi:hypothetical protein